MAGASFRPQSQCENSDMPHYSVRCQLKVFLGTNDVHHRRSTAVALPRQPNSFEEFRTSPGTDSYV